MHELELAVKFYSKELELLDKLNPRGISEFEDSGVVNSTKGADLVLGPVNGEARDATENCLRMLRILFSCLRSSL